MCGGKIRGSAAAKLTTCVECSFFRRVRQEQGARFTPGATALLKLGDAGELERSYTQLIETVEQVKGMSAGLVHSQKLAAVGTLAAGIAHEINTPAQFVNDSMQFLEEAFQDQRALVRTLQEAVQVLEGMPDHADLLQRIQQAEETADLEYLDEHVPGSFARCADGLSRIAAIVGAMKEFAHPDQREKQHADLNQALLSTLTIAKNEYKYVADVETELDEIPSVLCHVGDLNQAFLNLIVNAAHAIEDVVRASEGRGVIKVRTAREPDAVRIEIADTGEGIPDDIQAVIFDPFFTTKEVGKGSGQGLAIARSIVVDKHGGSLTFNTEAGKGTTFVIRLPASEAASSQTEAEA